MSREEERQFLCLATQHFLTDGYQILARLTAKHVHSVLSSLPLKSLLSANEFYQSYLQPIHHSILSDLGMTGTDDVNDNVPLYMQVMLPQYALVTTEVSNSSVVMKECIDELYDLMECRMFKSQLTFLLQHSSSLLFCHGTSSSTDNSASSSMDSSSMDSSSMDSSSESLLLQVPLPKLLTHYALLWTQLFQSQSDSNDLTSNGLLSQYLVQLMTHSSSSSSTKSKGMSVGMDTFIGNILMN